MRYPDFLPEKGTIGFVAPSFGCNIEPYKSAFDNAQKKLKEKGHSLILGPNCYEGKGIGISNTPEACGDELTKAYLDPASDILMSCGGGELMCETMDHVDFEAIKAAKPKWYMGFSDNTNMTFLLATLCDTAAIYGPNAPAFGMEPWHPSLEAAYELLKGKNLATKGFDKWEKESLKDEEHPLEPYNPTEKRKIITHPVMAEVAFEGRLIGGCMDCLANLLGTEYDAVKDFTEKYKEDGIIWFLEACDLNPLDIRRAIWRMKHAGWFKHVKGFLIGRPYCHGEVALGLDQYRAVTDLLAEYEVPVLMDLDIGHIPPMMTLICGSYAKVSLKGQEIMIDMECR